MIDTLLSLSKAAVMLSMIDAPHSSSSDISKQSKHRSLYQQEAAGVTKREATAAKTAQDNTSILCVIHGLLVYQMH